MNKCNNNKLDKFIRNNRSKFDLCDLDDMHELRFLLKLFNRFNNINTTTLLNNVIKN